MVITLDISTDSAERDLSGIALRRRRETRSNDWRREIRNQVAVVLLAEVSSRRRGSNWPVPFPHDSQALKRQIGIDVVDERGVRG